MQAAAGLAVAVLVLASPAGAQRPTRAQASPPAGDEAAVSITAFWRDAGDVTLAQLIAAATESNRHVHAAAARVQAARAVRTEAVLDLTPSVTAAAGFSRQRISSASVPGMDGRIPDQELWDAGVQMSWELDVFGRTRRSLEGRGELITAAEHDAHDVELLVAAEVARAYFDLRGMQQRLAVARRNADNQARTLELTIDRYEGGRGTALDTERAQAQLSSTLAGIPMLEAGAAAAKHQLAVLLGGDADQLLAGLDADTTMPALPAVVRPDDLDERIRRRPDVRSAASERAARGAFVGAARAEYLPRVSIGGVAGYTASQFDALGNRGTPRYSVGPVISWPLFDLGRVRAGVASARAAEAESAAMHEQTVLAAREDIEASLTAYRMARERLQHLEDAAAASERATGIARLRFEEGGTDFLEVLDAERRQLETQDRLATGRADAAQRLVSLYRALGGSMTARN